jgi:3-oxoacyl-[acyl-carrier protein] reductase
MASSALDSTPTAPAAAAATAVQPSLQQELVGKGQVALVTGASRGIGRAIALELAQAGATVVLNYAHSADAAAGVVAEITAAGGRAWSLRADVSNEQEVEAMVKAVLAQEGRLDVLVNNAGITRDGLLMRMKIDDWNNVLDLNLTGVFLCTRAVSRSMLKARAGRIINITSVVALMGNPGQANYSAAKAGVIGLTRSTAAEFASRGITVNAVAPGFIATEMTKDLNHEAVLAAIPLGRLGQPEEVAGVVRFLAFGSSSAYMTGQVLQVDGGMVMR